MSKKRVILYIIAISNLIGGIIGSLFMYQSIKNNSVVNWTDISINTNVKVIIFIISILFCLSPILIFIGKRKALLIFYIINISNILFEIITFIRAKYFIEDVEISNSSGIPIIKILIFVYLIKNELDEHNLMVAIILPLKDKRMLLCASFYFIHILWFYFFCNKDIK